MAVAQGYGKTVTSGSVFAYDVADTRNSYRGQPTTNVEAANIDTTFETIADGNTAGFNNQLGTGNYLGVSSTMGYKSSKSLLINRGSGGTGRVYKTYSVLTGQYSSVSCWVYSATAGPYLTLEYFGGDYSWGVGQTRNTHTGTGWELLYVRTTGPATSNTTGYYFLYPSIENQNTYWDNLQVEIKQYPTTFVNGTRSATQGLLPLVGNSTIDLSNVSFDSNAQMTFDGTNDGINLESSFFTGTENNVTFECIVKLSANQTSRIFLSNYTQASSATGLGIGISDSTTNKVKWFTGNLGTTNTLTSNTALSNGIYYHVVGTYNGSSKVLYINGTSEASATITNGINITSAVASIGYLRYLNNQYLNGEIPVAKIYNRALSAGEVKQNYLHYKTRFNLS